MKISLFQNEDIRDPRIEIYYGHMTPLVEEVIRIVDGDSLTKHLRGVNEKGEQISLVVNEILYFEAVDRRVYAYTDSQVCQVMTTIGALCKELSDIGFVRINKANCVNLYHIESIKPEANMRVRAVMDNGEHLIINRSYKKAFEAYLRERKNLI